MPSGSRMVGRLPRTEDHLPPVPWPPCLDLCLHRGFQMVVSTKVSYRVTFDTSFMSNMSCAYMMNSDKPVTFHVWYSDRFILIWTLSESIFMFFLSLSIRVWNFLQTSWISTELESTWGPACIGSPSSTHSTFYFWLIAKGAFATLLRPGFTSLKLLSESNFCKSTFCFQFFVFCSFFSFFQVKSTQTRTWEVGLDVTLEVTSWWCLVKSVELHQKGSGFKKMLPMNYCYNPFIQTHGQTNSLPLPAQPL